LIPSSGEVLIERQPDAQANVTRLAERPVEAHHVDAADHSSWRSRRTASLVGLFDLSHVLDRPLR
jgi:hypothetical protein